MTLSLVTSLRSVAMDVRDLAAAERFYTDTWRLSVVARESDAVYLRGSGADHHLLSLHAAEHAALRDITFRAASMAALDRIAQAVPMHGGSVCAPRAAVQGPGGGEALTVRDPQGRILRFVAGDARHSDAAAAAATADQPVRLAHAVLNSHDVAEGLRFYEQALGFRLSDRTRIMAFIRIPALPRGDHHSIALADADNDCLNHVAFVMPDVESVMRGGGRMRDAGYPIEWGPGRHGPGDNAFNYFVGPEGFVIEYTAEVEQVEDSYEAHGPEHWQWPPGRVDQWGISSPPSARLKTAQRQIAFVEAPGRQD